WFCPRLHLDGSLSKATRVNVRELLRARQYTAARGIRTRLPRDSLARLRGGRTARRCCLALRSGRPRGPRLGHSHRLARSAITRTDGPKGSSDSENADAAA